MRRGGISSDGQIKQEKKDLERLTQILSQAGPEERAHASAVVIQFLRDNPSYLTHQEGRAVMRQASEGVKGSSWESVLYPPPVSLETKRMLKDFRAKCGGLERKDDIKEREAASIAYIEERKREKRALWADPDGEGA